MDQNLPELHPTGFQELRPAGLQEYNVFLIDNLFRGICLYSLEWIHLS